MTAQCPQGRPKPLRLVSSDGQDVLSAAETPSATTFDQLLGPVIAAVEDLAGKLRYGAAITSGAEHELDYYGGEQ